MFLLSWYYSEQNVYKQRNSVWFLYRLQGFFTNLIEFLWYFSKSNRCHLINIKNGSKHRYKVPTSTMSWYEEI